MSNLANHTLSIVAQRWWSVVRKGQGVSAYATLRESIKTGKRHASKSLEGGSADSEPLLEAEESSDIQDLIGLILRDDRADLLEGLAQIVDLNWREMASPGWVLTHDEVPRCVKIVAARRPSWEQNANLITWAAGHAAQACTLWLLSRGVAADGRCLSWPPASGKLEPLQPWDPDARPVVFRPKIGGNQPSQEEAQAWLKGPDRAWLEVFLAHPQTQSALDAAFASTATESAATRLMAHLARHQDLQVLSALRPRWRPLSADDTGPALKAALKTALQHNLPNVVTCLLSDADTWPSEVRERWLSKTVAQWFQIWSSHQRRGYNSNHDPVSIAWCYRSPALLTALTPLGFSWDRLTFEQAGPYGVSDVNLWPTLERHGWSAARDASRYPGGVEAYVVKVRDALRKMWVEARRSGEPPEWNVAQDWFGRPAPREEQDRAVWQMVSDDSTNVQVGRLASIMRDTDWHDALHQALADVQANPGHTAGWARFWINAWPDEVVGRCSPEEAIQLLRRVREATQQSPVESQAFATATTWGARFQSVVNKGLNEPSSPIAQALHDILQTVVTAQDVIWVKQLVAWFPEWAEGRTLVCPAFPVDARLSLVAQKHAWSLVAAPTSDEPSPTLATFSQAWFDHWRRHWPYHWHQGINNPDILGPKAKVGALSAWKSSRENRSGGLNLVDLTIWLHHVGPDAVLSRLVSSEPLILTLAKAGEWDAVGVLTQAGADVTGRDVEGASLLSVWMDGTLQEKRHQPWAVWQQPLVRDKDGRGIAPLSVTDVFCWSIFDVVHAWLDAGLDPRDASPKQMKRMEQWLNRPTIQAWLPDDLKVRLERACLASWTASVTKGCVEQLAKNARKPRL